MRNRTLTLLTLEPEQLMVVGSSYRSSASIAAPISLSKSISATACSLDSVLPRFAM